MKNQAMKNIFLFLLSAVFFTYAGYGFGREGWTAKFAGKTPAIKIVNETPVSQTLDLSLFWQVFDLLNQKYLKRPIQSDDLLYGAIRGLTSAAGDNYTAFLTPEQNKDLQNSLNGQYEGIGAELGLKNNQLIIIAPLDGSPALSAGVRAGDAILKIDKESTAGLSLSEAVSKIRGKAGTAITLTLVREGGKEIELKINRERINVSSVKWALKENGVYYLRLSRFGDNTNEEWEKAIREITESANGAPASLVLDLRSNPGGFLESAVFVASEFVKEGVIVSEDFGHGLKREFPVNRKGSFYPTKLTILLNKGSASASEILAAALKKYRGAIFVGENSFGKGTVQEAIDLDGGSGVHITVARWLTPSGESIDGVGLPVDEKVDISEEDFNNNRDPQLEKALEVAARSE